MTFEKLDKIRAQAIELQKLQRIVQTLTENRERWARAQRFEKLHHCLRLGNFVRFRNGKDVREPRALLFCTESLGSTLDLDLTPELLELLRGFYQAKLDRAAQDFEELEASEV